MSECAPERLWCWISGLHRYPAKPGRKAAIPAHQHAIIGPHRRCGLCPGSGLGWRLCPGPGEPYKANPSVKPPSRIAMAAPRQPLEAIGWQVRHLRQACKPRPLERNVRHIWAPPRPRGRRQILINWASVAQDVLAILWTAALPVGNKTARLTFAFLFKLTSFRFSLLHHGFA